MRHLLCVLCVLATPAMADQTLSALLAAEAWNDEDRRAHGALMLAYDVDELPAGARFGVEYNTDTLRLTYDGVRLSDKAELGGQLTGEVFIAGLSRDYFRDGTTELDRVYLASYAHARAWLKLEVQTRTFFTIEAGARRWFFSASDDTGDAFELPPDTWVFEPRLHWAWWGLNDDAGWTDRHRLYPRARGAAIGFSAELDLRDETRAWGARDPAAFDPADPRNDPEPVAIRGVQWLRAGWQLHERVRTQFEESARIASGEDDTNRARVGGLNPYSVNVAGVPWAHYLTDDYAAVAWSWHLRVWGDLEVGPLADAVVMRDIHRTGDTDVDLVWGAGAFADWRAGKWQVDVRGGWSPSLADDSDKPAYTAWLSVGWADSL